MRARGRGENASDERAQREKEQRERTDGNLPLGSLDELGCLLAVGNSELLDAGHCGRM